MKDSDFEFVDRIPMIKAGIPAERRVVDAWFIMHFNAPY